MRFPQFKFNGSSLGPLSKLRLRRFLGLFWPLFDSFCGDSIRSLIQSPQKEVENKFRKRSLLVWVAGIITAGFLGSACYELWRYQQLEARVPAAIKEWKILEKSPSQFALKASYTFEYQGKVYRSKTVFAKPYHFNRISAEKQIKNISTQPWSVWIQPSHPERSSLQKTFPLKKCLYSLMCLGVFLYFFQLSHRLAPDHERS